MRQVIKHREIRILNMTRRTDPVIPNACLLSLEGVECPWQKQHLSLYIVRWSVGCAWVSSSKRQSRADEVSGSGY